MAAESIHRVFGPDAQPVIDAAPLGAELAERAYRLQVLARTIDEKAVSLSRQGRIGTYAPMAGQEAVQVGAALALDPADWAFPTYRDHAVYVARGVPVRDVFLALHGDGSYVDRKDPGDCRTLPPSIPVASHLPHAVGAGMAADYRGDDAAALALFGDGATSEGDFHEGLNFAGVFDAPAVFLCQNNQWAISTPFDRQTATDTVAEKASAYGFDGVRVDGNDVAAVYGAVREALGRAKDGEGPTLIEAVTHRRDAHTTTDDPSVYREDDPDLPEWLERDPLDRTRDFLADEHGFTDEDDDAVREWAEETVAEAVAAFEDHPGYDADDLFEHVYAEPSGRLRDQKERFESAADR